MTKVKDVYELFDDVCCLYLIVPEDEYYIISEEWEDNNSVPEVRVKTAEEFAKVYGERTIKVINAYPDSQNSDYVNIFIECE